MAGLSDFRKTDLGALGAAADGLPTVQVRRGLQAPPEY